MILGKHTGKAALAEKLKERGISVPDPLLLELLRRVKTETESQSKSGLRKFLHYYRSMFEAPGLSDGEFWSIVEAVGIRPTNP